MFVVYKPACLCVTELKSPIKPVPSYGSSMFRRVSISGLSEKESCITQPWQRLFDLVKSVGRHLHWKVADLFETTRSVCLATTVFNVHSLLF